MKTPVSKSRPSSQRQPGPPEVVDPKWLATALAACLAAALLCAWLTLCLLFYQGQWQLLLHPSHSIDQTPASTNLAFEPVRFDATATGQPRLTGWWLPAESVAQPPDRLSLRSIPTYAAFTLLYLHDGSGSLSATVPSLALLHSLGINVFAIDYRGFGQSDSSDHPTEGRMAQDAAASLQYLTAIGHISPQQIVPYGVGLGASLAVRLALEHPEFPAVILDNPDPDPTATALATRPSRLIPARLLLRQRFDIAAPLATITTPKLLIAGGPESDSAPSRTASQQLLFQHAASPHLSVTLPPRSDKEALRKTVSRFLDQYLPAAAQAGGSPP